MAKKHILKFGYLTFAVDSITTATAAVALFSKLTPARLNHDAPSSDDWFWEPNPDRESAIELKMNEPFREPKPVKPAKALALPTPKRGSILCICEKSYVAPKQSCPHCGRSFNESHSRTHGTDRQAGDQLKLD